MWRVFFFNVFVTHQICNKITQCYLSVLTQIYSENHLIMGITARLNLSKYNMSMSIITVANSGKNN